MIMPSKHTRFAESLLGLGSAILLLLNEEKEIDVLWHEFEKTNNTRKFPAYHTYDNFVLCIDFLYTIGKIDLNEDGRLYKCI